MIFKWYGPEPINMGLNIIKAPCDTTETYLNGFRETACFNLTVKCCARNRIDRKQRFKVNKFATVHRNNSARPFPVNDVAGDLQHAISGNFPPETRSERQRKWIYDGHNAHSGNKKMTVINALFGNKK